MPMQNYNVQLAPCSHYLLTGVQHDTAWIKLQCEAIELSELGLAKHNEVG